MDIVHEFEQFTAFEVGYIDGLTHVMDPGIDTGDILYQVSVRTRKDDTVGTLYDRIMGKSLGLVGQLVRDAEGEQLSRQAQPEDGASYFSSISDSPPFDISPYSPASGILSW